MSLLIVTNNLTEISKELEYNLTPVEKKLIELLTSCALQISVQPTFRLAGGWVHDKLLKLTSTELIFL